jgi:PAS domain S-box-containing protein
VEANNAALRLYGYRQEEILRLRTTDLSTDPLQTQASIARRETAIPLRWHRKKDGTVFPVEITGGYFESGGRKFHVAAVRDLTEVKRTEKILKQTEEQFRQAQKMEAIGQLAGGVAHDFNNILAAVLMYLGLLQLEPSLSPTTRASLKELEKDVLRGTSLTRQLLAFSRRQAMEPKTIDVKELLQGLFRMLHRLLGEHIDLILQGPDDLPPVNADPSMLEQVVINLCVNARDAMPQGGKLTLNLAGIELSAETAAANAEARPGLFLRLSVTDLGCGMDAETRRHLFEPFFTTKGVGNGTGLGLATVHGIIKQHDGWIEVESAVGHGSTFQIYLPACEKGVKEAIEAPPPPLGARGDEGVLLVEDEDSLRQVTITALERHGYRVFGASTGPEALLQWAAHHEQIHLLITDMVMPGGMDGREVAERLRSERANLRVILCTGYTDRPSLQGLDQVAGTILLRKPFDIPSLLSALRASLDAV